MNIVLWYVINYLIVYIKEMSGTEHKQFCKSHYNGIIKWIDRRPSQGGILPSCSILVVKNDVNPKYKYFSWWLFST